MCVCVVPCIAITKGMGVGERKGILHVELHLGKSKTALFCLNWQSVLSDLCCILSVVLVVVAW